MAWIQVLDVHLSQFAEGAVYPVFIGMEKMHSADDCVDRAVVGQLLNKAQRIDDSGMCATQNDDGAVFGFDKYRLIVQEFIRNGTLGIQIERAASVFKISYTRNGAS